MLRGGYAAAGAVIALGALISPVAARQVRDEAVGNNVAPGVLAAGVLTGGVVVSLVLAILLVLLSRSREQALRLCDRRTGQLRHQALHDPLTGLPNRALVQDRVEQMVARSRRSATRCAALFIDLDRFKDVNDTLGRSGGDELLKAASARLSGLLREADTLGRLGGDEFVVLVEGPDLTLEPEAIAERVLGALREPFLLQSARDTPVRITASIGIADDHDDNPTDLLLEADAALYRAKAAGRDRWVRFVPQMQTEAHERAALGMDLRRAIGAGELFVMYQPTVNLARMRLVGMEALVRWNHPSRGVTPGAIGTGQIHVGLILPLSAQGNAGIAAASMRNAAEMALAEFKEPNIQLLVKDDAGTPQGAQAAAQQAIGEGAEIIIGPLFAQSVSAVGQVARARNIPVIAFSTDASVAARGVYLLSFLPESDVKRIVDFAISRGKRSFAALLPDNAYGSVVQAAFQSEVARRGGRVVALEKYPLDPSRMGEAVRKVAQAASHADAIFIPDGADAVPQVVARLPPIASICGACNCSAPACGTRRAFSKRRRLMAAGMPRLTRPASAISPRATRRVTARSRCVPRRSLMTRPR